MGNKANHIVGVKAKITDSGAEKEVRVHLVITEEEIQQGKDAEIAIKNPMNLKGFDPVDVSSIMQNYGIREVATNLAQMQQLKGVEQMIFYQFYTDLDKEAVAEYIMMAQPKDLMKYKINF